MKKKLLLLFVLVIFIQLFGHAQEQKIDARYLGVSRIGILQDLSEKYEFVLDIKAEDFPQEPLPLQTFNNEPLSSVVDRLLFGTKLVYKFSDDKLVIRKSKNSQFTNKHYSPTRFNFSLSGEVRDAESGETLPYATINISKTNQGATTNMDGKFSLLQVPSDTVTLQIHYIGYEPILYRPTPSNAENFLTIHLLPSADILEEIVIEDIHERQLMDASGEVSKISIAPAQLASLPSFGEKDIFRSIQLLPGISGTNEATSGLYVRGGTPDQNLILFDGITVYHVDHFYGFFSAFNAEAVKDIQLYKGGFEPKYGGRLSSVVNITGKNGNNQNVGLHAGISALSANASVEVPLFDHKGSLLVAGRRSYTDIIKSGIYNDVFDLFNETSSTNTGTGGFPNGFGPQQQIAEAEPAFYYYDFNSKLTVNPSQKDVVSLSFYRGQDNLDNSRDQSFTQGRFGNGGFGNGNNGNTTISNSTTDLTNWGNTGSSLRWGRQWSPRFYSNLVASYSQYYSNRDRYSTTYATVNNEQQGNHTGNVERNRVEDVSLRWDNELKVGKNHNVEFGLQGTQNTISYHLTMNDTLHLLDQDDTGLQMVAYLQDTWEIYSGLSSTFGLRSTYFSPTESFYQEPRIALQYQLNPQWKLKGAWGKYYQFVNRIVREDVSHGTRDFWLLADDKTIPIGNAYHYIAGFSYEIDEFFFDVEGYYKDLTGLMEYTLRFSNGFRQNESNEYFYQGTGTVKGIDFLLQKKVGKYTGWVSYTLSRVEYNFPDISSEPYPALHDQTHEIKLINSYQMGRWKLAGTWMYATGKPYTAPVGSYTLSMLDGMEQSYVSIGGKNAFRLPAYHRMDLSATYQFTLSEKTKLDAGLSIFNLYGRKNIWYKEFEIVEETLVETDVEMVGFTPNIFVNINFN